MPTDTQSNDAWSWQVVMTADVDAADKAIRLGHFTYVSSGAVKLSVDAKEIGLLVRDPDGHATELIERR